MVDHYIPATPDAITPDWLTETLRRSGTIGQAAVEAVVVEKIAAGYGFVGQNARLHLRYDQNDTGAPTVLFAKLSSESRQLRELLAPTGLFETEVGFYRDLAESMPLRVPQCYASLYDEISSESLLLLEDLGNCRFGDNVRGCSTEEALLVIRRVAALHARFWNDSGLRRFRWLRSPKDELARHLPVYIALLPEFERRFSKIIPTPLMEAARGIAEWGAALIEKQCGQGFTLVHGDLRPDNFAFPGSGVETELIVFDWQVARRAPGARDIAYFLAFSLPVEQRRSNERLLLETYHEELLTAGIEGYSFEEFMAQYRMALASPVMRAVISCAALDLSSDRGSKIVECVGERVSAAVEDHEFTARGKVAYGKA